MNTHVAKSFASQVGAECLALIGHRRASDVVAWREGRPISAQRYLADVLALARLLPDAHYMINGCQDRYRFAVGMGAALMQRQISVLPHNHVASTLSHLEARFQGLYCLSDTDDVFPDLIRIRYPVALDGEQALAGWQPVADAPVARLEGFAQLSFDAGQVAACLFTSGSTGTPVAHQRTWGQIVRSALSEASRLAPAMATGTPAVLGTVPPQHSYGFESTVFLALLAGWSFAAERPFFPVDVLDSLDQLPRPRLLVTTPVHLRALLAVERSGIAADLVLSATAPLPDELAQDIERLLDAPVHEIYGSTETGQVATRRTLDGDEWQPLDGVTIGVGGNRTLPDGSAAPDGSTAPDASAGQAWAEGEHVGGRMALSDRIEMREAGRFVLLGRSADMVNIAGKRSSIAFLDTQLLSIDGVLDGAFLVADDDGKVNARMLAFVVAPDLTVEQITRALRERIESVFLPRPMYKVDGLPRDATGKLPRQRLLTLAGQLAGRAAS